MGLTHQDLTLSPEDMRSLKGTNRAVRRFLVQHLGKALETDESLQAEVIKDPQFVDYLVSLVSNGEDEEQLAASKAFLGFLSDGSLRSQAIEHGIVKAQMIRFFRLNETNKQILDSMSRVGGALNGSQTIISRMEEKRACLAQEQKVSKVYQYRDTGCFYKPSCSFLPGHHLAGSRGKHPQKGGPWCV